MNESETLDSPTLAKTVRIREEPSDKASAHSLVQPLWQSVVDLSTIIWFVVCVLGLIAGFCLTLIEPPRGGFS